MQPTTLTRRVRRFLGRNRWVTPRRVANMLLCRAEMKAGRTRLWSRPYQLCIDVSGRCNLRCPFCPTGRRDENQRGRGHIESDTFCSIIDELGPTANSLELFNWGEALFHPDLPRLMAHAARQRLLIVLSSNLSFKIGDELIRSVIANGLTHLTASIDGADQDTYEVYRRGGKFDLAIRNLRRFVELKREMRTEFPILRWQFLVFRHNEHQVEAARRMAAEIGVDVFDAIGGIYDDKEWAPTAEQNMGYLKVHENRCIWLWNKAVFHWDGGMASCCMGYEKRDDFGAWEPGHFGELWNNEKFVSARRIWTEPDSPLPEGHYCVGCDKVNFYRGLPLRSATKPSGMSRTALQAS